MRKIVIHRPGPYDHLTIETHPDPTPAPGEVVVAVAAIGVNYADCMVRMGLYASAREYVGWPITPGFEVAGHIEAVGDDVEGWEVGQAVFGVTRFDAYATRVAVPAEQLFALPEGLSLEEAAGFPAVFLTAWFALRELVRLRPSMTLLIHSAAGGVGGAMVQIGKAVGCDVVGVVGATHKVEVAAGFGADAVIDKSRRDLWGAAERLSPDGFDVVCDANGVATLKESYRHLASGGRLVVYGFHTMIPRDVGRPNYLKLAIDWLRTPRFNPLDMTTTNRSVLAFNLSFLFHRTDLLHEAMAELLTWLGEGKLAPPPVQTFPFESVGEAHRAIESAQTVGKLVLVVDGEGGAGA